MGEREGKGGGGRERLGGRRRGVIAKKNTLCRRNREGGDEWGRGKLCNLCANIELEPEQSLQDYARM